MNKYHCTITGKSYSEATIQANLSAAYKEVYEFEPLGCCVGCGSNDVNGSAHIIGKARCKRLNITSLIWDPINFFRACSVCNLRVENISSVEITELLNYENIKQVLTKYDPERASKLPL